MPSISSTLMNYNHAIATANSNSNIYNSSSLPIIQHNQNTNYQCSYLNSAHSNLSSNTMILNSSNEHNSLLAEDINSPHVNINIKPTDNFKYLIKNWAIEYNVPQNALNKLLGILKQHTCFSSFPIDSRTLMHNKPLEISKFQTIESGSYYHFGIEKSIKLNMADYVENSSVIEISVGIDGLPLFKSSPDQSWPILACIRPKGHVFPIGIYYGKEKPSDSNKYISNFVEEAKYLVENGIKINNKVYDFRVGVLCCDAPAKSYILRTKGHSGFSSCSRCEQEGEYVQNRVCFPYLKPDKRPPKRSDQNYLNQLNEEHHTKSISIIATIPNFDVYGFSMDYLHLVCLGTVRKLINLWIKGPIKVRYPSWKINEMSILMNKIKVNL